MWPSVVHAKGPHVEPAYVGIHQDRRVENADDPDCGRQGVKRRWIYVRELGHLPLVVFREALPDKLQDMPRRCGVHHLWVGRLPGLALGQHHALQGRARNRQAGLQSAESPRQGRHCGGRLAAPLDVHQRRDSLDVVMRCEGGRCREVGLVDRAAHQGHAS